MLSTMIFLMAAASYYLSNRYAGEKILNPLTEGALIFIFLLLLIGGPLSFKYMKLPATEYQV